jgi:hypothetical protein
MVGTDVWRRRWDKEMEIYADVTVVVAATYLTVG